MKEPLLDPMDPFVVRKSIVSNVSCRGLSPQDFFKVSANDPLTRTSSPFSFISVSFNVG